MRRRLENAAPALLARPLRWLAGSAVIVAVAVAGIVARDLDVGVEFTGGRLVELATARPIDPEAVRMVLAENGFPRVVVQDSGDGAVAVRSGELDDADVARIRGALATETGGAEVLRDELIGPSLGAELRRNAFIALAVALAAQLAYLALRFRWAFSVGAVAALAANVAVVVGAFAWLGRPIDGVFLAALLTVIGYTVNDSVVVFDRIREAKGATAAGRSRPPFAGLVGRAVLSTLPRTVNTGLSTLVILAALLVVGGETLADFALALIIGIVAGTASTIAVAAPLAIHLDAWRPVAPPKPRPPRRQQRAGSGAVV